MLHDYNNEKFTWVFLIEICMTIIAFKHLFKKTI